MIKGSHHTEEHKKRISEKLKGKMPKNLTSINANKFREGNPSWKGGFKRLFGYVQFLTPNGCRFSCMKDGRGYVFVHRLVMASHLNRPLRPEEVVHHKNNRRDDNRIENLVLFKNKHEHLDYHNKLRKEKVLV